MAACGTYHVNASAFQRLPARDGRYRVDVLFAVGDRRRDACPWAI